MPIDVPAEVVNESASMYAASAENLATEVRRVAECLVLAAMPEHRIHCLRSNGENTLKFFHHGGVNASKSWDIMTKGPVRTLPLRRPAGATVPLQAALAWLTEAW